jgi:hypothetical protein
MGRTAAVIARLMPSAVAGIAEAQPHRASQRSPMLI